MGRRVPPALAGGDKKKSPGDAGARGCTYQEEGIDTEGVAMKVGRPATLSSVLRAPP